MAIVAHGSTGGVGLPAKLAGTGPGSQRLESCGMSGMILDELSWRGLIAQSTDLDTLAAEAQRGPMTVYAGFDPTAPSLHAGHLVPLLTLRRFQRAGHRPIVLAGGATGMIGDPRDVGERSLNEADTVAEWTERIRGQLERFVDFDDSPMGAIVENNLEWTGSLSAIEFLRDIGKHFSVNVMLARDTIRRRLAGRDLLHRIQLPVAAGQRLRRIAPAPRLHAADRWCRSVGKHHCRRPVGAPEARCHRACAYRPLGDRCRRHQVRQINRRREPVVDPQMTSPYAWYQYFVNTADADVIRYLRWFTFLSADELAELEQATAQRPQQRAAQRRLASELTVLVHGEAATAAVEHASRALFGRGELARLDEATLAAALRETTVAELKPGSPDGIVDLLVASGLSASKGAARRTIHEGGVSVNNIRVDNEEWVPQSSDFLHGRWLVLRRGKRSIAGVERIG